MSKRPQFKSSGLGAHPLDEPGEQTAEPQKEPATVEYPHKLSFYLDEARSEEVRGAFHAQFAEPNGDRSMSDFMARAVVEKVQRLRDEINDGKEFPRVEARKRGRGRAGKD